MTDEYLRGAVSTFFLIGGTKLIFFRRNKSHLEPLRLAKLFCNKQKFRLINVHSTRGASLLII